MKRSFIAAITFSILGAGILGIKLAIAAPAKAAAHNLAAINGLIVGKTTESELLTRKEFQTLERLCIREICLYQMKTENTFLNRLHLAPETRLLTSVDVRGGLVTRVLVSVLRAGRPGISLRQELELPRECLFDPCVRRLVLPSKTLVGITIEFSNDSGIRNRIPEIVNSECLSRLHGCNTYSELMPIAKELNLDATGQ